MVQRRPVPVGFDKVATNSIASLMRDFHCSVDQINRWREELGVGKGVYRNSPRGIEQLVDGQVVNRFKSIREAERVTGFSNGNIWKCANGFIDRAYGFQWRYTEERKQDELFGTKPCV